MAGIGVRLNRIFEKNTLTTNLVGFFYSTVVTVAPMFVIIINLILMEYLLDFVKTYINLERRSLGPDVHSELKIERMCSRSK